MNKSKIHGTIITLSLGLLFFFLLPTLVLAQLQELKENNTHTNNPQPLNLSDGQKKYRLGAHLLYLEDPKGQLTIDDVASEDETHFIISETDIPSIGFTTSTYWLRIQLRNENHPQRDWRLVVNQPSLDFIDFYSPDPDGGFTVQKSGDQRPFRLRQIKNRLSVFKVELPSQAEQTLYLRFQSTGTLIFDLALWQADAFNIDFSSKQLFLGVFLGVLCVMGAYNFFLFLTLGDRAYLHYVLFLIGLILHFATLEYGVSFQYLWPDIPRFNQIGLILFPAFTMIFALNFAMAFLQTRVYASYLHRCMLGLRFVYLILAIASLLQVTNWRVLFLIILTIASIICIMLAGIQTWRKGFQPARYYLLAWSLLWFNSIIFLAHMLGLISVPNHLQFAPFTITGLVLFLSLALADRINVLKRQAEDAKAETVDANLMLEEHQHRLVRSEKKYRTLFEESNDMIFMTDLNGQIEEVSPACQTILGYTRAEALGQNAMEIYVNPDDRTRFQELVLDNGSVRDFQIRLFHKDGREVDTSVTASLRYAKDDSVLGFQGIIRDVTADKQIEAEKLRTLKLQSEKELAEAANRAKSVFLANMSHELRTPLNVILGFSELMTRDPDLTSEQQQDLETIGRSGEHLLALINDVLEFSKIDAGKIELRLEKCDLRQMLLSLEEMFFIRAQQKELTLKVVLDQEVPRLIVTDQNKLRQVLINLLGNALKFTRKGGITLRVSIGDERATKDLKTSGTFVDKPHSQSQIILHFEIIDTGKGIAAKDLQSIFQAFFQIIEDDQTSQGTGLGLPISQEFVRMLGGNLMVSSSIGLGSRFYFDIPVKQLNDSDAVATISTQRVIGIEAGQPVYRILVVEDNDNSRDLLMKLLRHVGFKTRQATNGSEAIEAFEQWLPHLIWMDIRMPVMDGYEATRRIKARLVGHKTTIIALTASAFEEDRIKILQHGCDDFIRKPFKEAEIFEKMQQFLGVRYLYEPRTSQILMAENTDRANLTPELLREVPGNLQLELKNAADVVDFQKAIEIIETIRTHNEIIADALIDLVNHYRFDSLQELLNSALKETPPVGGNIC